MQYTNKHHLPAHICQWLTTDEYDYLPGTISITTLIGPPRAWALKQRYHDALCMDYSDLMALRYGTALHDSLGSLAVVKPGDFRERRFTATLGDWTITGKPDAVTDGVLRDFKSTSVWKYTHGSFHDYVLQLSGYRWLLAKNQISVPDTGYIDFLFTDWKRSDARKGGSYPPCRYAELKLALMSIEETEEWLLERLRRFARADETLPYCTDEELWKPPTTYAVYKTPDAKKAFRVCTTHEEAQMIVNAHGGIIRERIGKARRCAYCVAAPFCVQCEEMIRKDLVDA